MPPHSDYGLLLNVNSPEDDSHERLEVLNIAACHVAVVIVAVFNDKVIVGRCFLKLCYLTAYASATVPAGYFLGFDEIPLVNADPRYQLSVAVPAYPEPLTVSESSRYLTVSGNSFTYTLDRSTGLWSSLLLQRREFLTQPMELNIWRAPTDNDRNIKATWYRAQLNRAYARAYAITCEEAADHVRIVCEMGI